MDNLRAALNMNDVETLLEAVADWESLGNQDFYAMQQIKNVPIPDEEENEELFKLITALKKHYTDRASEIKAARAVREEKSVFVRAKLMMIKQKISANMIWENPDDANSGNPAPREDAQPRSSKKTKTSEPKVEESDVDQKKFDLAVQYMTEVGADKNFNDFLASEKPKSVKEKYDLAVQFMTRINIINNFNVFLTEKTSN